LFSTFPENSTLFPLPIPALPLLFSSLSEFCERRSYRMVPISLARLPSLVHSTGRLLMRPFKLLSYISREIPHEVYRLDFIICNLQLPLKNFKGTLLWSRNYCFLLIWESI
jgi:hypothetical protein